MFAYLQGEITEVNAWRVILDVGGIGFSLLVPQADLENLRKGEERKLYTHFALREDGIQLYGFLSPDDLDFFNMLLSVSGIGPKGALGILGSMQADDLRFAILSGDAGALAKAPGIGKKTAQKIILELKDKLDLEDAFEKKIAHRESEGDDLQSEAVLALEALGYAPSDALRAVRKAVSSEAFDDVELLLKAALKEL